MAFSAHCEVLSYLSCSLIGSTHGSGRVIQTKNARFGGWIRSIRKIMTGMYLRVHKKWSRRQRWVLHAALSKLHLHGRCNQVFAIESDARIFKKYCALIIAYKFFDAWRKNEITAGVKTPRKVADGINGPYFNEIHYLPSFVYTNVFGRPKSLFERNLTTL